MDFMKVIDQTVRDLKREVNIKVLKIPEIEQKVLDATSNEPWGPHGSDLAEIAQATKKFADCPMIMNVLWTRLTDTGRNWRHVYKALAVIEYLMANGSERVVDDVLEHTFQISSLSGFEFVELNGKDMGINVRKKVETIMALLNNKDKIQEIRNKAVANRDKYVGLSSNGMTYKSSSASYSSGGLQQSDRYGGFGSLKEDYRDQGRYGDESDWSKDDTAGKVYINKNDGNNSKKEPFQHRGSSKASATVSYDPAPSQNLIAPSNNDQDDFDDFDPRGSSTTGSLAPGTSQVDLFGESLIDLMDAPPSGPTAATTSNSNVPANVDLFADATFVSASPHVEAQGSSSTQCSVDLFAQQSPAPAFSSPVDLFAIPTPSVPTESRSQKSEPMGSSTIDPFAAFPINNFDGFDVFGDFTSSNGPTQNSTNESTKSPQHKISTEPKAQPKKDTFQVKSGIWADSLSRGLIDLNISAQPAAKKVSLADIGIVGGLTDSSDEKDKGLPSSAYMGKAMGMGSNYSNPRQNQYGSFI